MKRLLVVDGHSWMHRAFHAIASALTAPDGRPTNAVFGFFAIMGKVVDELRPDGVVVAFDAGKPAFRTDALARYKAQRPPADPNLEQQFPIARELLEALDVPVVQIKGWEGDDILGTLSAQGEAAGMEVFLASGDRDIYQLISARTSVVTHRASITEPVIITPRDVSERYGIGPELVCDYLGLKGDVSDNIPGIPGVGEKTASRLLQEYGTLDGVIEAARAGKIKGKVGESLATNADLAYVSRTVATICRDVAIEPALDLESLRFGPFDSERVNATFMSYRLKSPLRWILAYGAEGIVPDETSVGCDDPGAPCPKGQESAGVRPKAPAAPGSGAPGSSHPTGPLPARARTADASADGEDDMQAPAPAQDFPAIPEELAATALVVEQSEGTLFDLDKKLAISRGTSDSTRTVSGDEVAGELTATLARGQLVAGDLRGLITEVCPPDSALPAALDLDALDATRLFDIPLAAYLLNSSRTDFSLETLALEQLGYTATEEGGLEQQAQLAARLALALQERLEDDGSTRVMQDIEMPLLPVLLRMERTGFLLDTARLAQLAAAGAARLAQLQNDIWELAGHEFNIDSPKQLAELLFDELGLPPVKTGSKSRSTDASVLAELAPRHAIAARVSSYREIKKLQSTYIEALPKLLGADHRLHTRFNQTVAATGRLSSSNPNLQNIPVRTDLGRRIREAFIPSEPDWQILSVDYSQIELRVLAHLSEDPGLIEAFKSGEDFHRATASRIFGVAPTEVDAAMRSRSKAVNFGIIYGQGARALAASLDISYGEAQAFIDRYYQTFPRVKEYLAEVVAFAREHGWVATLYGRKRRIPELNAPNHVLRAFGERTAMNHPMQGTAADLIKLAMIAVDARMRTSGLRARLLVQVHDELVFEVPPDEIEALTALVTTAMTGVATLRVDLEVSVAHGPTWAQAK
ncbi:MAG: DNA polymerase I [Coriobacteriia bacterium]|nr:DNA polymerase I [Coriobacteriia bacterium]